MRSVLKAGMLVLALAALPVMAQAGTLEGIAIGAGTDAGRCRTARRGGRRRGWRPEYRAALALSSLLDQQQWLSPLLMALNVRR